MAVLHFLLGQEQATSSDLEQAGFGWVLEAALDVNLLPMFELLHERKAVGFTDTIIREAARCGRRSIVHFLYEHREQGFAGHVAADQATQKGYLDILQYFQKVRAGPFELPFEKAAANGHWRVVRFLYENTDVMMPVDSDQVARALQQAVGHDHLAVVKYLLSTPDRIHINVQEAFCRACPSSFVNVVRWLVDNEADWNWG